MGATKRAAEAYCQALDLSQDATRFMTVRFGNVLGSTGSVIPLFQSQLARGGPLTVTDPNITRFFMTIPEASRLILHAAGHGIHDGQARGQIYVLDMGKPIFEPAEVPTTIPPTHGAVIKAPFEAAGESWLVSCVSMGNPHCLVYARGDGSPLTVNELDLPSIGPAFEAHPAFPAKTNTEFVQVLDKGRVRMRVWERGAAETLACGTGACATVVAGVLEGRIKRECVVELPGGPLEINWRADNDHVMMTGPGEKVYSGELTL